MFGMMVILLGIGDTPYVIDENNQDKYPLMKPWSPRVVSVITISAEPATVTEGSNVTISGEISPVRVNVDVTVYYRLFGGTEEWSILAAVVTDSVGRYAYVWTTTQAGTYELKACWPGDDETLEAESEAIIVNIGAVEHPPPPGVHNLNTGLSYVTIQEAIDASETLDGHTIKVDARTYFERVTVYKSLNLIGENRSTTIIDGFDGRYSPVVYVTANKVNISEFTIRSSGWVHYEPGWIGVVFGFSNHSSLSNNIIVNNYLGVVLSGSSENSISGNNITGNHVGIFLEYTHLNESTGNMITGNVISYNIYGIGLEESSGNTIYHNNFINNMIQASVSLPHINTWDNGYPSGGNYWSDYSARYPDAQELDDSGIWDTPYVIDEGNQDNYPLMEAWSPLPRTIDELKTEIEEFGSEGEIDNQGIVKSLIAKLKVAEKLVDKGKVDEAKTILEDDFIPQVQNLSGIHITVEAADILIQSAEYIQSHL